MRLRAERLPEDEVINYWNTLKQELSDRGISVSSVQMPHIMIFVNLPHRDYMKFYNDVPQDARNRCSMEEFGEIINGGEAEGCIGIGEPTVIVIRKSAAHPRVAIRHELLHLFEYYLGMKSGSLTEPLTNSGT
jgi:hypothetical protein